MFRLKKSTKYAIVIIIVIASIFFAAKFSNISNIFNQRIKEIKVDDKRAEEVFNEAANDKKIKLLYHSNDLEKFSLGLQSIYNRFNINPIYANNTSQYHVSVFSFNDSLSDNIMQELRKLQKLNQEFLDTADQDDFKINIADHIKNKERVKKTLESKIDNAIMITEDRINKYNQNLTRIQMEIDSLRNQQKMVKELANNKLVFVSTVYKSNSQQSVLRTRRIDMIKNFALYFLAFLVISILILVMIYYFFIFILHIMRILGIRTARSTSRGSYGYGGYSYKSRYYSKKPKKVKKIYKDADGNIIKQKISKE